MSRPLRIEFADATYHVTSRGNRREPICRDDDDRRMHLEVLAQAMDRFDAHVLAYCLMGNHYHLVLMTHQPNLSRLMRHLNGVYTQKFNRLHGLVGHLFQGRFKAILVDRDAYLLALCRYVERNPVAAGMVQSVAEWRWSSYAAHVGAAKAEPWLDVDGLHGLLMQRELRGPADRRLAAARYANLVNEPSASSPWDEGLRQQIFLGDEAFVAHAMARASPASMRSPEIPRAQRKARASLGSFMPHRHRDEAIHAAYREGGLTMTQLAAESGLSVSRVSRIVRQQESVATETGEGVARGKT